MQHAHREQVGGMEANSLIQVLEEVRSDDYIIIKEDEIIPCGPLRRKVVRLTKSRIRLKSHDDGRRVDLSCAFNGIVDRCIIDHDDLMRIPNLLFDRIQTPLEVSAAIPVQNNQA